jgi:hypothetical protein
MSPRLIMPTILDTDKSVLHAAAQASTLVGNTATTVGSLWPDTDKVQIGDLIFLRGIVPRALDKRPIAIDTESQAAMVCTLAVSPADPSDTAIPGLATREHFALIRWGTANGQHQIEIDVCVGNGVSIPAASIEVSFFDETPRPSLNSAPVPRNYPVLVDSVNLGHFARSGSGWRTRRIWQPFYLNQSVDTPGALQAVVDEFTAGGYAPNTMRPIPPFSRQATVITASLDLAAQVVLFFLSRRLSVVGVCLFSHALASKFGVDRVAVPSAAEFCLLATSLAAPLAPLEQADYFFVRFDLEF